MAKYTWTEIDWMWERDKLTTEQAIGQLIQWGQQNHEVAVRCQQRLETQAREIEMLMEANIRLSMRVEALEKQAKGESTPDNLSA